ncbi:hypothetical protein [Rhodococcus maanshanensis]|uniref:Uncharacterized protein n=1 Tax=Rhodococcus maanshanensis TaxID=183556 RepID=A0A1H7P1M1_9NOCA|nr:hypothetical protein [Rhodococcus maanshanensis]SEL29526.1 hypothetical protein SAMN05444583_107218 [Rhodococcus maanshanensis]
MNVEERLAGLNVQAASDVSDQVIEQDVRRGRAALRRIRVRRGAIGGGVAFALAAAVTVGATGVMGSGQQVQPVAGGDHPSVQVGSSTVRLVAYTGDQPAGYTISRVPEGFVLQGSSPSFLTLARQGDNTPANYFVDKILVSLESAAPSLEGGAVSVHGAPAVINVDEGTRTLHYTDGAHSLLLQAWSGIGLTDAQLVDLAEGVTVTPDAVAPVG